MLKTIQKHQRNDAKCSLYSIFFSFFLTILGFIFGFFLCMFTHRFTSRFLTLLINKYFHPPKKKCLAVINIFPVHIANGFLQFFFIIESKSELFTQSTGNVVDIVANKLKAVCKLDSSMNSAITQYILNFFLNISLPCFEVSKLFMIQKKKYNIRIFFITLCTNNCSVGSFSWLAHTFWCISTLQMRMRKKIIWWFHLFTIFGSLKTMPILNV